MIFDDCLCIVFIFIIVIISYTMRITDDHGWSNGNGSFSGLIGNLQREESDFGAAGSLMRLDRMTAVDFTVGTVSLE